jgi:hypothetical protein
MIYNVGRLLYTACSYALPAYAVADGAASGHDPLWLTIIVSCITVTLALAYTAQRNRIKALKLAVVRMEAKQDATITYLVKPEGSNDAANTQMDANE